MRYWLLRTRQNTTRATDSTACRSWPVHHASIPWNATADTQIEEPVDPPEDGDRIVLLRTTGRPSFIGLGHVRKLYTRQDTHSVSHYVSIDVDTSLVDDPVPVEYVRSHMKLGPLGRTEYIIGGDKPMELTPKQWEAITSACTQQDRPTPQFLRWTIQPGDVVDRADLHDIYGGARSGAASPCASKPHVLIFLGTRGGRAFPSRDAAGQLIIEVKNKDASAVYGHLREGRALRVFRSIDDKGRKVRYLGSYLIASDDPGTHSTVGYIQRKYRNSSSRFRTEAVIIHAIAIAPHGPIADVEYEGIPVGRAFIQTDENIVVREAQGHRSSPELHTEANRSHRRLQNRLAEQLGLLGYTPLSPQPDDVLFDLAFFKEEKLVIVEVKSVSHDNQAAQFRDGFAQVCEYAEHYLMRGMDVTPVLYTEKTVTSERSASMAQRHGVLLGSPQSEGWLKMI